MDTIYIHEKKEPKMLDMKTIRKINDGLVNSKEERRKELRDWQWLIMLENESKNEDWD